MITKPKHERITKAQQERMHEYLTDRLGGGSLNTIKVGDLEVRYISPGNDQALVLVDQEMPNHGLHSAYESIRHERGLEDMACIFFKNGKTFYRSAIGNAGLNWKIVRKYYDVQQIQKMITFRPEEVFIYSISGSEHIMQYYQPDSDHLHEGIMQYTATPVSHLTGGRILPADSAPTKLKVFAQDYLLENKTELLGRLILSNGHLVQQYKAEDIPLDQLLKHHLPLPTDKDYIPHDSELYHEDGDEE